MGVEGKAAPEHRSERTAEVRERGAQDANAAIGVQARGENERALGGGPRACSRRRMSLY
jgi:hypothetical protein